VTGVIDPPPPQGIGREWEWEWELTGNGKHATIPGPFANAIPRMAKGMTTAVDDNPPSQKHNGWHCCDLQPQGPRSRAFYYSRNSLLHTWITYYTELPMKVPITHHHLENRYYAPPPIAMIGNHLTPCCPSPGLLVVSTRRLVSIHFLRF